MGSVRTSSRRLGHARDGTGATPSRGDRRAVRVPTPAWGRVRPQAVAKTPSRLAPAVPARAGSADSRPASRARRSKRRVRSSAAMIRSGRCARPARRRSSTKSPNAVVSRTWHSAKSNRIGPAALSINWCMSRRASGAQRTSRMPATRTRCPSGELSTQISTTTAPDSPNNNVEQRCHSPCDPLHRVGTNLASPHA